MIQYRIPVRNNSPQQFTYVFRDQNGTIIDLTNSLNAYMELKLQGQVYVTLEATMLHPVSFGTVYVPSYVLDGVGVWEAQFFVIDGAGNKLPGEILQFSVVANVEDLTLNQLATY